MRIKELLKEKGLTQQELADMVGVSHQSMKQTLNAPSKIAAALGVPVWQLFASPEEVKESGAAIICPKCHSVIPVEIEIKPKK